jgi:hypothetical protein
MSNDTKDLCSLDAISGLTHRGALRRGRVLSSHTGVLPKWTADELSPVQGQTLQVDRWPMLSLQPDHQGGSDLLNSVVKNAMATEISGLARLVT